ncbi:MAG: type II secretion system protein J [Vicinamibacterales bacterium]
MTGASGFSLIELLVALTICALLSGAIAAVTPQARAAFDATPEALDLLQRERTLIDVLSRAVRSAARLAAVSEQGEPGVPAPAIELLEPDADGERFHALRIVAVNGHGHGVLESDQPEPSAALRLRADTNCPAVEDVCGFSADAVAAIVDAGGRLDIFTIGSANQGINSVAPAAALARSYGRGSAVFAVTVDSYRLDGQLDGSLALVRETAAGAVQPVVDNVLSLNFTRWPAAGVLSRLDMEVQVGSRSSDRHRRVATRTRRVSIALRNPS